MSLRSPARLRRKIKRRLRRAPLERRYRTISYAGFLDLCKETGDIAEPGYLLSYLHNAGTVFYRRGLFDDRIILDQGWALEAIYAVFHREKCYTKIKRQHGRFTRSDLAEWIWDAAGYAVAEQELFLSMMQSCGVCFEYRRPERVKNIEAEYIAPDLLPVADRLGGRGQAFQHGGAIALGQSAQLNRRHVPSLSFGAGDLASPSARLWGGQSAACPPTDAGTARRAFARPTLANSSSR